MSGSTEGIKKSTAAARVKSWRRRASWTALYNDYRDYDPSAGKYIGSDPIGLNGGFNTYAYVRDDPLSYIDSKGLFSFSVTDTVQMVDHIGPAWLAWIGFDNPGVTLPGSDAPPQCTCTGCSSSWTLVGCSASLHLVTQIKQGMTVFKERQIKAWEREHVEDFQNGIPEVESAGNRAESDIKKRGPFLSKAQCEQQSSAAVFAAIAPVIRSIYQRSKSVRDDSGSGHGL